MKKTMILTLAVLGMVMGSFTGVLPVKAQDGGPCGPVIQSDDCQIQECGNCLYHECKDGNFISCF